MFCLCTIMIMVLSAYFPYGAPAAKQSSYDDPAEYYKVGDMVFHKGARRAGILGSTWPLGKVNYAIDSNMTDTQQKLIVQAINLIESKSCIRFKRFPTVDDIPRSEPAMKFNPNSMYCQSAVGYNPLFSRPHIVDVQTPECGFGQPGDIAHELFHALGFWHEQTRKDRDNYVYINTSNISPGAEFNFMLDDDKYGPTSYYGVPYNYDSIMHYGPWFTSKSRVILLVNESNPHWGPNAKPEDRTIVTLRPKGPSIGKAKNIGYSAFRNNISKGDELMLERMYWNECRRNSNGVDYPPFPDVVTWKPASSKPSCRRRLKL